MFRCELVSDVAGLMICPCGTAALELHARSWRRRICRLDVIAATARERNKCEHGGVNDAEKGGAKSRHWQNHEEPGRLEMANRYRLGPFTGDAVFGITLLKVDWVTCTGDVT